jgi:hypothetical protein
MAAAADVTSVPFFCIPTLFFFLFLSFGFWFFGVGSSGLGAPFEL